MTVVEFRLDNVPDEEEFDPQTPLAHFSSDMSEAQIRKALLGVRISYSVSPDELAVTYDDLSHTKGASFDELEAMREELTQLHRAEMSHPIGERALAS